jgi:Flp pilus assembly protein TadB
MDIIVRSARRKKRDEEGGKNVRVNAVTATFVCVCVAVVVVVAVLVVVVVVGLHTFVY